MRVSRREARRAGLTVVEVVVAVVILAFLAALMMPVMRGRMIAADAGALASTLRSIRQGIDSYREHTGWYPSSMFQLQFIPGSGDSPLTNSCGAAVAQAPLANAWRGAYVAQRVGPEGMQVGAMTVSPDFTRLAVTGTAAYLGITVSEVPEPVANRVDEIFDGELSLTTGAITWTNGTLTYHLPVLGC